MANTPLRESRDGVGDAMAVSPDFCLTMPREGHVAQILSRVTCLTTVGHYVSWITNLECEELRQERGQSFM